MHRSRYEPIAAAVVELSLNPIELFLFVKPCLRKPCTPKRAVASSQQFNHSQGVFALSRLDSQPRLDSDQERLSDTS
jgi:hypothetical protein